MIKTWRHKGIKRFYLYEDKSGIDPQHASRIKIILQTLDAARNAEQMNLPSFNFHRLKGDLKGFYAVTVSANWRVIFSFSNQDAILIDYLDYH